MIAGLRPRRPDPARAQAAQDLRLRPAAAGLPGLQRPDQAALRPRASRSWRTPSSTSTTSSSRPRARRRSRPWPRDMAKELGAGNAYPDLLRQAGPVRSRPDQVHGGQPGRLAIRRLRQQVLAGLRDLLRLRPLLRQLAPGRPRHPRLLRSGHLRRPERVHGRLRHRAPGHPARHQQHRALRHVQGGREGRRTATSPPTCSWASTAATRPRPA